ncbi:LysE family translocator [Photobacterium minamisatsumaniensis]|uniref:LysE family translocator n=1 Tax=Photobacterium minamisatsumaniensis TaxID=2910233 RepID=UPI003D0D0585
MELLSLAIFGILIVISPGADFVVVLKNSLNQGRKAGVWTAIGISLAICVHISYSLLGISYLISQNAALFASIKYAGAAYLIFIGIKGLISDSAEVELSAGELNKVTAPQFLIQGFLCNVLNPKTMLFFLSIFSQLISPDMDENSTALLYGGYMIIVHALWFSLVAILFTSKALQSPLIRMKKRLNQVCGAGLITFGSLLAIKS